MDSQIPAIPGTEYTGRQKWPMLSWKVMQLFGFYVVCARLAAGWVVCGCAEGLCEARRTEARRRRANTASVAIGRQSSRATKKKLPRRRTFCRTKPAPKRPPRGQTNIARGSGHPSEANDSNLDALRARQSPLHVGDPKRSKKRLFLHVSRPVHPRAAPGDQRTACCDRGTPFGPTRPPCTERGRVDSSYVKSRYPPPSCTTWEAPKGYTEGTSIPISPK